MSIRLAFLITEDWYFCQHFLALAIAAQGKGHEVHVLCRTGERGPQPAKTIRAAGLSICEIAFQRSSLNPFADIATRHQIVNAYQVLRPDIVHHIALKPIIHGQAAAKEAGIGARVNFLPGFGHVFTANSMKARLLRPLVSKALSDALTGERAGLIVMNRDDQQQIAKLASTDPELITILPGTGVDLLQFKKSKEPEGRIIATYLGRFLREKGLGELVEAGKLLNERSIPVTIRLVGAPDPRNPTSIRTDELESWAREDFIELRPWTHDVPSVWREAHLAVLPSYREGFGMSLAEAAASARALIACDVPGCRDAVRDRVSGLLVPPRDPVALAGAIETLGLDTALRRRFAAAARQDARTRLSLNQINRQVLAVYDMALGMAREEYRNVYRSP